MTRLLSKERRESSVGQWGVSGYTPRRKASGLITLVMWETGLASTSPHDLISLAFLGPHCVRVKCTMWWVSTQAHIWETTTTLRMVSIPTTSESLLLSCCFLSFQGSACPPALRRENPGRQQCGSSSDWSARWEAVRGSGRHFFNKKSFLGHPVCLSRERRLHSWEKGLVTG